MEMSLAAESAAPFYHLPRNRRHITHEALYIRVSRMVLPRAATTPPSHLFVLLGKSAVSAVYNIVRFALRRKHLMTRYAHLYPGAKYTTHFKLTMSRAVVVGQGPCLYKGSLGIADQQCSVRHL